MGAVLRLRLGSVPTGIGRSARSSSVCPLAASCKVLIRRYCIFWFAVRAKSKTSKYSRCSFDDRTFRVSPSVAWGIRPFCVGLAPWEYHGVCVGCVSGAGSPVGLGRYCEEGSRWERYLSLANEPGRYVLFLDLFPCNVDSCAVSPNSSSCPLT